MLHNVFQFKLQHSWMFVSSCFVELIENRQMELLQ